GSFGQPRIVENGSERLIPIMVKIQVDVPDHGNLLLGPSARIRLQGVHAEIAIGAVGVFESEPGLQSWAGELLSGKESLNDVIILPALDHDSQTVARLEVIPDELPRGDRLFGLH